MHESHETTLKEESAQIRLIRQIRVQKSVAGVETSRKPIQLVVDVQIACGDYSWPP